MMRIADPHLLWLLLAAPAVVLAYAIAFARRRRSLKRLGEPALIARMAASVSVPRKVLAAALVVLAVAFLALALARPQAGGRAHLVVCSRGESATNGTPAQRTKEAKRGAGSVLFLERRNPALAGSPL